LLAIIDRVEAEGVVALRVPLRVELKAGPNWAELTSQASGS
jgi:DNA polymerase I-like protein with 3'-5' exonuclease and polymerase domains